jgi:hypothetical protein
MMGEDSSASKILFFGNDLDGNNSSSGTTLLSNRKIPHFLNAAIVFLGS